MDNGMQQSDKRNKRNNQNRAVFVALIALFVTVVCIVIVFQENRYQDMYTQKLILTREGCNYISSLNRLLKNSAVAAAT